MNLPFIRYNNLGGTFVRFVTIHACDGRTDRQTFRRTDTFAVAKTALHICSAVKIQLSYSDVLYISGIYSFHTI